MYYTYYLILSSFLTCLLVRLACWTNQFLKTLKADGVLKAADVTRMSHGGTNIAQCCQRTRVSRTLASHCQLYCSASNSNRQYILQAWCRHKNVRSSSRLLMTELPIASRAPDAAYPDRGGIYYICYRWPTFIACKRLHYATPALPVDRTWINRNNANNNSNTKIQQCRQWRT